MKHFFLTLASLVLAISVVGCGSKPSGDFSVLNTPVYSLRPAKKWVVYEYPGQFLDAKNAYSFALLTYAPVLITSPNQDQDLSYGFTIGSFYNQKVSQGIFDKEILQPIQKTQGIEPVVSKTIYISGVKCRWEEAKITFNNLNNIMIRIDIPLDHGYIEIDAWGPADDKQLIEDFRELPETMEITNKNHFKEHPEIGKRFQP